jgi:hypothetical protein
MQMTSATKGNTSTAPTPLMRGDKANDPELASMTGPRTTYTSYWGEEREYSQPSTLGLSRRAQCKGESSCYQPNLNKYPNLFPTRRGSTEEHGSLDLDGRLRLGLPAYLESGIQAEVNERWKDACPISFEEAKTKYNAKKDERK